MGEEPPHRRVPAVVRGAGLGALLGGWTAAWAWGFLVAGLRGWLNLGIVMPERHQRFVATLPGAALDSVCHGIPMLSARQPALSCLALVILGAVVGFLAAVVAEVIRLDPRSIGRASLLWGARGMFDRHVLLICALGLSIAVAAPHWDTPPALFGLAFLKILAYLAIPVLVCRLEVAAQAVPANWWEFRWPGWRGFMWFMGAYGALLILSVLRLALPTHAVVVWLGLLTVLAICSVWAPLFQGFALTADAPISLAIFRPVFTWRCSGPWIAYNSWLLMAGGFLLAPVGVVYLWCTRVVPVVLHVTHRHNADLGVFWRNVIFTTDFTARHWEALVAVPLAFLFWLGTASFVFKMREVLSQ